MNDAISYVLTHAMGELNIPELEKSCGVGVVITEDEIEDTVRIQISLHSSLGIALTRLSDSWLFG